MSMIGAILRELDDAGARFVVVGGLVTIELEGARVRVASIPDPIAMKRAAGRPEDLEDIEALEAIAARASS